MKQFQNQVRFDPHGDKFNFIGSCRVSLTGANENRLTGKRKHFIAGDTGVQLAPENRRYGEGGVGVGLEFTTGGDGMADGETRKRNEPVGGRVDFVARLAAGG